MPAISQEVEMGELWIKVSTGKKLARPHLNKMGMVVHICENPSYKGGIGRKIVV
jgi:hypothetical protein